MFDKAKPLATVATKAKGKSKQELAIAGLEQLAMVDALTKALETVKDTFAAGVKQQAIEVYFRPEIERTGRKPESMTGTEGQARASIEMRKRGTNMPLNPAQVALLREHGVEPEEVATVPELFAINPIYGENKALLDQVTAALTGIVPDDFIMLQPKQSKFVVSDATLEAAFSKKAPAEVIAAVTVMACKPRLAEVNMTRLLDFVRDLINGPTPQPAANEGAAALKQAA